MTLEIPLKIFRYKAGDAAPHYDTFKVQVAETANLLDAIEVAWAEHDRTLTFRHACHHASCGSCAVRVNGVERLPCIAPVAQVWPGQGELLIEPLRNFPIISDLVVDVAGFFQRMLASGLVITRTAETTLPLNADAASGADVLKPQAVVVADGLSRYNRFEDCIECGICISACPTMAATDKFFGPAGLAAIYRARLESADKAQATRLLELVDGEHGVWRCHSANECTESCPQNVDPAGAIMALRRDLLAYRFKKLFG